MYEWGEKVRDKRGGIKGLAEKGQLRSSGGRTVLIKNRGGKEGDLDHLEEDKNARMQQSDFELFIQIEGEKVVRRGKFLEKDDTTGRGGGEAWVGKKRNRLPFRVDPGKRFRSVVNWTRVVGP